MKNQSDTNSINAEQKKVENWQQVNQKLSNDNKKLEDQLFIVKSQNARLQKMVQKLLEQMEQLKKINNLYHLNILEQMGQLKRINKTLLHRLNILGNQSDKSLNVQGDEKIEKQSKKQFKTSSKQVDQYFKLATYQQLSELSQSEKGQTFVNRIVQKRKNGFPQLLEKVIFRQNQKVQKYEFKQKVDLTTQYQYCEVLARVIWPNLTYMDLYSLDLSGNSINIIFSNKSWTKLQKLDLSRCQIGDQECKYLSQAHMPNLQELCLDNNKIGNSGFEFLVESKWFKGIQKISLDGNWITLGKASIIKNSQLISAQSTHKNRFGVGLIDHDYPFHKF